VAPSINEIWNRIELAFAAFFAILFKGRLPASIQHGPTAGQSGAPASAPAPPAREDRGDRAVQLLALLQREGRLVDFVTEDLSTYSDAQIGAAVRDIHAGCRRVLDRYVTLEPVVNNREGDPITLGQELDTSAIRLVGNVTGKPPFSGRLLHRGWRISHVQFPPLGDAAGRAIVAQAEIEIA
jgi:hypothetical protein